MYMCACMTLCDPMNCSPPGSSVHGILQARKLGVGCRALLHGNQLYSNIKLKIKKIKYLKKKENRKRNFYCLSQAN